MDNIDEKESCYMYAYYGIAEWHEKCQILSEEQIRKVKKSLENDVETPLVSIVRLPFPKFAVEYFRENENAQRFLCDPAFGYKLYFLSDKALKTFAFYMRNSGKMRRIDLEKIMPSRVLTKTENPIFDYKLDDLVLSSISTTGKLPTAREVKLAYLSQYIDLEEAKRLGLKKAQQFEADMVSKGTSNGFELEEKLNCLNMTARYLVLRTLGLYGYKRHSVKEVSKELGIPLFLLNRVYKEVVSNLLLTLGEFKNKIGFVDRPYAKSEYFEYRYRNYKKYDLDLELCRIFSQLSDLEKTVLSGYSNLEVHIYIAYKYMFMDAKKTMEYLVADSSQVQKMVEFVDNFGANGGTSLC